MRRLLTAVMVLHSLATAGVNGAVAQDASPTAPGTVTLVCTTEPRPTEEILAIWFQEVGGTPERVATPTEATAGSVADLPRGAPADEATRRAVTDTLFQWFVCLETDQFARAFGVATDAMILEYGPRGSETREEAETQLAAQLAGTPVPLALPRGESLPEFEVVLIPDGRAGLLSEDPAGTLFFVFARQDGRWLVDDLIVVVSVGTPGAATPAP